MTEIRPSDLIFSTIGHRYEVISGGPWLFRVQPLTPNGLTYVPFGAPVLMGRSDIDQTRLPR